jgi:hypothetical protein
MLRMWNEIPLRPLYQRGVEGVLATTLLQPFYAEVFGFNKLVDPVFPNFPADGGLLHSAHHQLRGYEK